jgi:hypothetical protein
MITMHGIEVTAFEKVTMIKFIALSQVLIIGLCSSCCKEVYNVITFAPTHTEEDRAAAIKGALKRDTVCPTCKGTICNT